MKLVKLTELEKSLAAMGYRLEGSKKPMSEKQRKAIGVKLKAAWAAKRAKVLKSPKVPKG